LKSGAPVWVDYIGNDPTEYAIVPLGGTRVLEEYINGGSERAFPFAFQSVESTADNAARLANSAFFETFAAWLDTQTNAGTLPNLGSGKKATSLTALGWGILLNESESQTGIYQVQCQLVYEQEP
jgi:hypothetical protein